MIKKSLLKISALMLIVSLNWAGFSAIIETFAYFNDTEISLENSFSAGTLDFSLTGSDFSPSGLNPGGSTARNTTIQKDGNLDFQYKINYEYVSGNLCDYLDLIAGGYSGSLKNFIDQGPFNFSDASSRNFVVSLPLGISDSFQGEVCNFKFVFTGWQEGLAEGQGFNDTEEIQSTISANYWNPPVVLNEILPNLSGDDCSLDGINGEWVEIYNKTSDPLDLADWYIKNSIGTRITISTLNTLGGSTTIGADGWLVVFMDGCVLDNVSDVVTLYNNNDIQADSYSYAVPDYNINNTPGLTNDMVMYLPFDGDTNDQSGNSNNGTNNGAIFASGKFDQGLNFDGGNDYVNCGTDSSLNILSELTIEAWIKSDTVIKPSSHSSIVDRGNSYWFLILNTGKLALLRFNQNDSQTGYGRFSIFSTTVTIPTGEWAHVAATYSVSGGNAVKLYINGELKGSGSFVNGPIDSSSSALTIGNRMGLHNFDGIIDEAKIYNRVLGASEVLSHYGQVPENKSYARIPDGSSNWVDPIPTPGGPNIEMAEINNFVDETELIGYEDFIMDGMMAEGQIDNQESIESQSTEEVGIIDQIVENISDYLLESQNNDINVVLETISENSENIEMPIVEEETIIEEQPAVIEETIIEEQSVVGEEQSIVVEEQPIVVEETIIEEQPAIEEQSVVTEESIAVEPSVPAPVDLPAPIE